MMIAGLRRAGSRLPNFERIERALPKFAAKLGAAKTPDTPFPWYPYDTLANIPAVKPLFGPKHDSLLTKGSHVADIGGADGDLSFLLESVGLRVDFYDNAPTNMNGIRGAKHLRKVLGAQVNIHEIDLDSQFKLERNYDLVIFLGILYHLKNPFFALEMLAKHSRFALVSTRIAKRFRAGANDVSKSPAAYLVAPDESNGDPTNFWIFSLVGLERLFSRAGWKIASLRTLGPDESNPQDNAADQRAFALLERE